MTQQNGRDADVLDEDGESGEASLPGATGAAASQHAAVTSEPASSASPVDSTEPASAAFSADSVSPVDPAFSTDSVHSTDSADSVSSADPASPADPASSVDQADSAGSVDSVSPVGPAFSADSVDSAGPLSPADPAVTSVFSVASIASATSTPATVPTVPEVPDIPAMPTVLTAASESVNGRDSADSNALSNPANPGHPADSNTPENPGSPADSEDFGALAVTGDFNDYSGSDDSTNPANPQTPGDEPNPETLMIEQVEQHDAPVGAAASPNPPQISLAPIKKLRAQFNPLADGLVYLVVFLGGFVGTAVRYGVSALFPSSGSEFPVDTFIANVAACFLFSLLAETMAHASWIRRRTRQLLSRGLGLGLCGGLSTMSTMAVESLTDMLDHEPWMAVSYMVASVVAGTICCIAGVLLAHVLTASRAAKSLRRMSGGSKASHNTRRTDSTSVGGGNPASGNPASGHAQASAGGNPTATGGSAAGNDPNMPAAFEPTPITAEIPLVPDPVTGEVH